MKGTFTPELSNMLGTQKSPEQRLLRAVPSALLRKPYCGRTQISSRTFTEDITVLPPAVSRII